MNPIDLLHIAAQSLLKNPAPPPLPHLCLQLDSQTINSPTLN